MSKTTKTHTRDGVAYVYENEDKSLTRVDPIDPITPVNSLISEDYVKRVITSDMVSVTRAKGKIPIGDPLNDNKISLDWVGLTEGATYLIDASYTTKGIIEIADDNEVYAGTDTSRAVTPSGLKKGIQYYVLNSDFIRAKSNTSATSSDGNYGVTQTTNFVLSYGQPGYDLYATTSKAIVEYINGKLNTSTVDFISNSSLNGIVGSAAKTQNSTGTEKNKDSTLSQDTIYTTKAINAYQLYNYVANKDLIFNVNNQTMGGIVFRTKGENTDPVTINELGRLYVESGTGNFNLRVGSGKSVTVGQYSGSTSSKKTTLTGNAVSNRVITLLDGSGNSVFPGTVSMNKLKLTNTNGTARSVGSITTPIYINTNGEIDVCNIGTVASATKATQDGAGNVITDTYLPLSGGTVTGTLVLSRNTDLTLDGTDAKKPALIVGGDYTGKHLELDPNELQAKSNATTATDLYLNDLGGDVLINASDTSKKVIISDGSIGLPNKIIIDKGSTYVPENGEIMPLFQVRYRSANTNPSASGRVLGGDFIYAVGNDETNRANSYDNYLVSFGSNQGGTNLNAGDQGLLHLIPTLGLTDTEDVMITSDGYIKIYPGLQNYSLEKNSDGSAYVNYHKYSGPLTISAATYSADGGTVNVSGINNISAVSGTFSGDINVEGNILTKKTNVTRGTAPATNIYMNHVFKDRANNYLGAFETAYYTNKGSLTALYTYKTTEASGNYIGRIGVGCNTDGKVYTIAPTPAETSNDTNIATTAFVKTIAGKYLPLTGGTVTGQVTLSGTHNGLNKRAILITGNGQSHAFAVQDTGLTKGTAPSSTRTIEGVAMYGNEMDSSNKLISDFYTTVDASNTTKTILKAFNVSTATNQAGSSLTLVAQADGSNYASLSQTPATTDNSTKIATTAYVKNNLSNYLPLTGGKMTGAIYSQDTGATKGTKPTSNRWQLHYVYTDKNNVLFGGMERGYLSDGTNRINMIVYPGTTNNTNTNAQIGVGFDGSGNWFTYAPTPATSDNSTKIATTAFVKSSLGSYLPLSGGTVTGRIIVSGSHTYPASNNGILITNTASNTKDQQHHSISINSNQLTKGTKPSGTVAQSIDFYGKNMTDWKYRLGGIDSRVFKDNTNEMRIFVHKNNAQSTEDVVGIAVGYDKNNAWYTYAPTPASGDSSTKIATTEFVKSVLSSAGVGKVTFANGSSTNGWVALNSGLILQWGVVASARNQKIMFHRAINVFSIVSIPLSNNDTRSDGFSHHVKSYTTTYFISFNEHSHQDRIFWMALGSPA